jgi:hypothetical protein
MLVFLWLLQILLKLTVFILSLCVGLLTNNFLLLLFTFQLNVQYRTLVFRCKQKGSMYINALSSDWLHVGWSGILVQLPGTRFISLKCRDQFQGPQGFLLDLFGASFLGVQWLGCEVDHLPPSSAEVKNNTPFAFVVRIGTPLPFTFVLSWEWWGRMINALK